MLRKNSCFEIVQTLQLYLLVKEQEQSIFTGMSHEDITLALHVYLANASGMPRGYKSFSQGRKSSYQALQTRVQRLEQQGWITLEAGRDRRTTIFHPTKQLIDAVALFVKKFNESQTTTGDIPPPSALPEV